MSLEGRVAVVTGGGGGIGSAVCRRLAADGANVVVADLDLDSATRVAESVEPEAIGVALDVCDTESVESMVATTLDRLGRLDILVNNAGITDDNFLEKLTDDQWDRVLDVNLKGAFRCTRAVTPTMRQSGYGRVVNISSIAGVHGTLTCVNYCASKAGVLGLTAAVAREFGRYVAKDGSDLTCNAVIPGLVDTDLSAVMPEAIRQQRIAETPLNRLGAPDDVADVIAFLASHQARFVTGVSLRVDGGLRMSVG